MSKRTLPATGIISCPFTLCSGSSPQSSHQFSQHFRQALFGPVTGQEQGLGIEWVKLINSLNTYISGAIDGTLAKSYNELILFRMAGITPGSVFSFRDLGFDFPEDGLYVTEEFYKANKDMCRRFVEASRKGWEWVRNNREAALDIVMKYVKYENVATNRYVQKWMLDDILEAQQDKGQRASYELSRDDFERLNEVLFKYGYISAPLDYDRFIGVGL